MDSLEFHFTRLYHHITECMSEDDRFQSSPFIDGIPIRKLFIGNLAERTTFKDVKNVFSIYGTVESCYLCRNEGRKNYAFITFKDVPSAMRALKDGYDKRIRLHNRDLRVMAADSWNQPDSIEQKLSDKKLDIEYTQEYTQDCFKVAPINMLNDDCLTHIFQFLSITERIRVERVCKRWRILSQESWCTMKKLDISRSTWGQKEFSYVTTAMLRKVLLKCGQFLTCIDISEIPNHLSISTLTMIAKFCPNLTNINISALPVCVTGLHTLTRNCKKITSLSLGAWTHVLDNDLKNVFKECQDLQYLTVTSNKEISSKCLSYLPARTMHTLIMEYCHNIVDAELSMALAKLENLEYLKIKDCYNISDETIEAISNHCKNLRKLRFYGQGSFLHNKDKLSFTNMVNLRVLHITHFSGLSDEHLVGVALSCPQIMHINISDCYNVTDDGLIAITTLPKLEYLCINHIKNITDHGLKNVANLKRFECHSCSQITDDGVCKILASSPQLQFLDISTCCSITNATYDTAKIICDRRPSNTILKMCIWKTSITVTDKHEVSPFLQTINVNTRNY